MENQLPVTKRRISSKVSDFIEIILWSPPSFLPFFTSFCVCKGGINQRDRKCNFGLHIYEESWKWVKGVVQCLEFLQHAHVRIKKIMYIWIFKSTGRDDQSLHESMTFFSWEPQKGDHHFDFIEFLKSCLGKFQKYLSGNFWGTRLHYTYRKIGSGEVLISSFIVFPLKHWYPR